LWLIDAGADINVIDNNGMTALDMAESNNCTNVIDLLKGVSHRNTKYNL